MVTVRTGNPLLSTALEIQNLAGKALSAYDTNPNRWDEVTLPLGEILLICAPLEACLRQLIEATVHTYNNEIAAIRARGGNTE